MILGTGTCRLLPFCFTSSFNFSQLASTWCWGQGGSRKTGDLSRWHFLLQQKRHGVFFSYDFFWWLRVRFEKGFNWRKKTHLVICCDECFESNVGHSRNKSFRSGQEFKPRQNCSVPNAKGLTFSALYTWNIPPNLKGLFGYRGRFQRFAKKPLVNRNPAFSKDSGNSPIVNWDRNTSIKSKQGKKLKKGCKLEGTSQLQSQNGLKTESLEFYCTLSISRNP